MQQMCIGSGRLPLAMTGAEFERTDFEIVNSKQGTLEE
jgi:hypothetical protein